MLERHAASQFKAQANVSKRFDCCWGSPVSLSFLSRCLLVADGKLFIHALAYPTFLYLFAGSQQQCLLGSNLSVWYVTNAKHPQLEWNPGILEPETLKLQLSGWKVALQSWMIFSFFLGFSWPLYLLYQVSVSITLSHSLKLSAG